MYPLEYCVLVTFVLFFVATVFMYRRKRYILAQIAFAAFFLLILCEVTLFDPYMNPRKAKVAITNQEKNSGGTMGFYLAPGGKIYPTEADYKKALSR